MFANLGEALAVVTAICEGPAVAGDPADLAAGIMTDAHKYSKTLIRNGYVKLHEADEQFIHSTLPDLSWVALVAEIRAHANGLGANYPEAERAFLNRILDVTTAFVNSRHRGFEGAESNISIPDMLLRCWNLAKAAARRTRDASLLTQVLNALDGNIANGGGCMTGVVARLFPVYARFLQYQLNNMQAPAVMARTGVATRARAMDQARYEGLDDAIRASIATAQAEDEMRASAAERVNPQEARNLATAIRASLQQLSAAVVNHGNDEDSDEDLEALEAAINASLQVDNTVTARQPAPLLTAATMAMTTPRTVTTAAVAVAAPSVVTDQERRRAEQIEAAKKVNLANFRF